MMVWNQRRKGSSTKSPFSFARSARHHPMKPLPVSLFFLPEP